MNEDPTRVMRSAVVLYMGRIAEGKRIDLLIDGCARRLRSGSDLRLVIAGLGAVVVGLMIAVLAMSGGGDGEVTTVTETVQQQLTATTPTTPTTETPDTDTTESGGVTPAPETTPEDTDTGGGVTPPADTDTDTDTGGTGTGTETTPSGGISPGD